SGVYTVVENLMMMPDVPADAASREAAREHGLREPETQADMARQLLDLLRSKMPAEVVSYDSMLGLYFARTYLDLYMLTGNPADLEAVDSITTAEADRFAQLVKYATTLDPVTLQQLGRSETYALQYLGEALALKNIASILAARPEMLDDAEALADLEQFTLETDLRIAPLVFVQGYDYGTLSSELSSFSESQQAVIRRAMKLLQLNAEAGIDPTAESRRLMEKYDFTPAQWDYVLN
ncbi:MAG: hypothetical protein K2F78_05590, partial [Muribaculaceae bacterium]|nr:hypothetical protein [Muribaculaceae bacterium]